MHGRSVSIGLALAATLAAGSAFASGREGEALADFFRWIVFILLGALAITTCGGIVLGGYKARQKHESVVKGCATGFLKGLLAFVAFCAASFALATLLGGIYMAYAVIVTTI
jgi:hypothetical protein